MVEIGIRLDSINDKLDIDNISFMNHDKRSDKDKNFNIRNRNNNNNYSRPNNDFRNNFRQNYDNIDNNFNRNYDNNNFRYYDRNYCNNNSRNHDNYNNLNYKNYRYNNNNQSNYGRNDTWHNNNQRKQIQYSNGHNNYQSYSNNSNNYRGSDYSQRKQIQYNNSNNYRGSDNSQRKQIQYNNNDHNINNEEIVEEKVNSIKNKDDNDFNINNLSGGMLNDKDKAFKTTLKVNDIITPMQVDTGFKHTIILHECESKLTNGPINKASVKLHLKRDAQPKIISPRRIPYSKIDLVSNELKKWMHDKIIEPVNDVRWASPITAVYKDDGGIRLCADFKDTVNPALEDFRYPLPRIIDLIAKLSEGKKFTKINFKNSFLQVKVAKIF
ncbi:probable serine/threonine-protein kinase clkA [Gordionus sp. m RMFG-2023]|uniref:probable serine/threonine-protein kinase clkA n=1 Tax=Gordionus sp. m RMFG-2023 TaxID=3053472 RepID=UPI0031FBE32B